MPKTKNQNKRIREVSKARIVDAAFKVLAEKGYETPVSEIAREAGVSTGLLYNYFDSKEELVRRMFTDLLKAHSEYLIRKLDATKTPYDVVKTSVYAYLEPIEKEPVKWLLMQRLFLKKAFLNTVIEVVKPCRIILKQILEEAFEKMGIENSELEFWHFRTHMEGILSYYCIEPKEYPVEEMKKSYLEKFKKFREID